MWNASTLSPCSIELSLHSLIQKYKSYLLNKSLIEIHSVTLTEASNTCYILFVLVCRSILQLKLKGKFLIVSFKTYIIKFRI